jgi:murein DD-endopeptidase MepM/ murein hydrolase activator NlpD
MYPQHLDRLHDDGSVRRIRTGGGRFARTSPPSPEVSESAPVPTGARPTVRRTSAGGTAIVLGSDGCSATSSDAWPLPVADDDLAGVRSDPWPLVDVDALQLAGAETADAEPAAPRVLTPETFLAVMAAGSGPRHRRPSARIRPSLYVAAALIGAAGVGVAVSSGNSATTAQADEPVSVAEELGMVQAAAPTLTHDEAADRLQAMAATRAEREDAQAAAAQVQQQADQAAAAAAAEAARPKAVLPVQGARLSSGFGYRWGTLHAGLDFAAPMGTPEYAAMDGVVIRAGAASGFGLAVYIQHPNGDVTVYGHMDTILVAEGQAVKAGDTIALLGMRGQSTGPHLHFEVHKGGMDGEKVDPLPWLRDNGVQV